ncbi:hypothetical protein CAMSH0001_2031 [Campylobacter showae RM3277]|uniref:Uncharacterized protein n=1 Tax=Campylobacter showae RM3277 TaxID=553219 RepID=C6RED9_9BACT|nr:hypothetical protein CAMSH0001_2031 [Campylobacter showae RM3277]
MIVSVFWLIFYPFFGLILQILGKKTADLKANLKFSGADQARTRSNLS